MSKNEAEGIVTATTPLLDPFANAPIFGGQITWNYV